MRKQREKFLLYRIREHRDEHAFAELHNAHSPHVDRFLRSKLPSTPDAHDALAATFLRLWNYVRTSEVEYVSALIFTIARGVVAEYYRANTIETQSLDSDMSNVEADDDGEGAASIADATDIALAKEALESLPSHYQEVLILRYVEGMRVRDIARHLQKSENATRVMIHRGIKKMRNRLTEDESTDDDTNETP